MTRKACELTEKEIDVAVQSWMNAIHNGVTTSYTRERAIATAATRRALTDHGVKPISGDKATYHPHYADGWNACLEAIRKEIPDA